MVKNMVDFFLLLLQSGGGDELQGIKKGIVEIADALVITKADGDNLALARKTQAEYQQALHVLSANDVDPRARVLTASSITGDGIPEIWTNMISFLDHAKASGHFDRNRTNQNLNWFNDLFRYLLHQQLNRSPEFQQKIESLNERILQKNISPTDAAVQLLSFLNTTSGV